MKFLFGKNARPQPKPPEPEHFRCTYCSGTQFYEGPSGGLSTNIMCANPDCQHWFNHHRGIIPVDDLHQVTPSRKPSP